MKKIFVLALILVSMNVWTNQSAAIAQTLSVDTVRMVAIPYGSQTTDSISYSMKSTFTVFGNLRIDWLQERLSNQLPNASKLISMEIAGITGTWTDIQTPGQITFNVLFGSKSGTVHIEKSQTDYTLTIHLAGEPGADLDFQFNLEPSTF